MHGQVRSYTILGSASALTWVHTFHEVGPIAHSQLTNLMDKSPEPLCSKLVRTIAKWNEKLLATCHPCIGGLGIREHHTPQKLHISKSQVCSKCNYIQ